MGTTDKPRVLLDTSVLLAWIKGEPECDRIADLLDFLDRGEGELAESTMLLAEIYKRPVDRAEWGPKMESVLAKLRSRDVLLVDMTRPVAERAAQYRLAYQLKTPDAVHLATAVLNRCSWLVTLDTDFPAMIEDVKILNLRRMDPSSPVPWAQPVQDSLFSSGASVVELHSGG